MGVRNACRSRDHLDCCLPVRWLMMSCSVTWLIVQLDNEQGDLVEIITKGQK